MIRESCTLTWQTSGGKIWIYHFKDHCLEMLSTKREHKNKGIGWKPGHDAGGKRRLRTPSFLTSSVQWVPNSSTNSFSPHEPPVLKWTRIPAQKTVGTSGLKPRRLVKKLHDEPTGLCPLCKHMVGSLLCPSSSLSPPRPHAWHSKHTIH